MKYQLSLIVLFIIFCNITNGNVSNSLPSMTYDEGDALDYLLFSYSAYCQRPNLTFWDCPTCESQQIKQFNMVSVIYNITTDTQAFVGYRNNQVIVSFRGSMDIQSWITNFQFIVTPYPNCPGSFVHEGFYKAWLSVKDLVQEGIANSLNACGSQCNTLVITGHSLGAAISSLCMADMVEIYPDLNLYSYSFGSPRVGDATWATYYNKIQPNQFRVVNQHDIVPHVAPQSIYNYHHVSEEIWYYSNATYDLCNDSGEDPSCSDSVIGYSIYDHLHYFDQPCCCKTDSLENNNYIVEDYYNNPDFIIPNLDFLINQNNKNN